MRLAGFGRNAEESNVVVLWIIDHPTACETRLKSRPCITIDTALFHIILNSKFLFLRRKLKLFCAFEARSLTWTQTWEGRLQNFKINSIVLARTNQMIVRTVHILFMRLGKHWALRVFGFSASLETERRYRLIFGKSGLRLINFSRCLCDEVWGIIWASRSNT